MHLAPLLQKQNRERIDNIPNSKENCIIFHRTKEGFDYCLYTASITDGKLSREKVQETLIEIEKTIRLTQKDPPSEYYYLMVLAIFLCFFVGSPLLLVVPFVVEAQTLAWLSVLSGLSALCCGFWCEHRANQVKAQLILNALHKYNLQIAVTGFQWVISGHNPKWIELHKLGLNEDQEMQENSNVL